MKAALRKELIKIRENIENKDQKGEKIAKSLLSQPFFLTAQTIMVYMSYRNEVDTFSLIDEMLAQGKKLCAPVCTSCGVMVAKEFGATSELLRGAYGILEPQGKEITQIDLVIVPGVGFNDRFHRLGYGAGYYDRFLSNTSAVTCGLFYDEQRTEFLEEAHDLPLDYIITETKILKRV